jgi:hypothetical protein
MKRTQRGSRPRGISSEKLAVAEAEAVSRAEGRIRPTDSARSVGAAGVYSPRHAIRGVPQEPGRARHFP